VAVSVLVAGIALCACGGSNDTGAEQLAKQQELQAVREQAARDARQSAKIAELERRLKHHHAAARPSVEAAPAPAPEASAPAAAEAPPSGVWRGEAVIEYDSGESAPFMQTVHLGSLEVGQVSGYSEALQGSTTCHGPLTYLGNSEGWYQFSSEEQNQAECIDSSTVELLLDGSGDLSYRETTGVSVSTGDLAPVP